MCALLSRSLHLCVFAFAASDFRVPRQSIRLVELVQRELGLVATSAMVLRSADVHALAEAIQCEGSQARQDSRQAGQRVRMPPLVCAIFVLEGGGHPAGRRGRLQIVHHGVWEVPRGLVPILVRQPVVELPKPQRLRVPRCVRYGGPGHLDVDALQRASDRACARHSALRTMELRDEGMREAMDRAAAMWQRLGEERGHVGGSLESSFFGSQMVSRVLALSVSKPQSGVRLPFNTSALLRGLSARPMEPRAGGGRQLAGRCAHCSSRPGRGHS